MPPASRTARSEPVIPLVSHRAIYKVTLLRALGAKTPTSARGRVSYEFTGSPCDGYSQIFRQITEIQPGEGATRLSDMRSATFEDVEGTSFSFDVKTTVDSNPPDVVDGHANKKKNDVLAIELSKPTSQTIAVGSDVLVSDVAPQAHHRGREGGTAHPWRQGLRRVGRRQEGLRHDDDHRPPHRDPLGRSGVRASPVHGHDAALAGFDQLFRRGEEGRGAGLYARASSCSRTASPARCASTMGISSLPAK